MPGSPSGDMQGVALKPLTVDFHEPGFISTLASEHGLGSWFQLSDKEREQAGSPWGPANPQSLNRYSYVLNNPIGFTDPTGHDTYNVGVQVSGGGIVGLTLGFGWIWDDKGNGGFYATVGWGVAIGASVGAGGTPGYTNADTIMQTAGEGRYYGVDSPIAGVDRNPGMIKGERFGEYEGVSVNVGPTFGGDLYVGESFTIIQPWWSSFGTQPHSDNVAIPKPVPTPIPTRRTYLPGVGR